MPRWIEAPQGSDAWLKSRIGNLTASRMADALDVLKKGGESEKRRRLKLEIVAERLSGRATEVYVNDAMKHGIKFEPECRSRFEDEGFIVELCGLAFHDDIPHLAASPDGLISNSHVFECKCPSLTTFLQYKLDGVVPPQYRPQLLLQMLCTGRTAGWFAAYHPYLPYDINLFHIEYTPSAEDLQQCQDAAVLFLSEVDALHKQLLGN